MGWASLARQLNEADFRCANTGMHLAWQWLQIAARMLGLALDDEPDELGTRRRRRGEEKASFR